MSEASSSLKHLRPVLFLLLLLLPCADHHFHYGYILYGCAIVAKFDAAWAATFRDPILALVRDYANPSTDDPYFTQLRQFDIFDSHSWAAGLFVFADGRNQVGQTSGAQRGCARCRRRGSVHDLTRTLTRLHCMFGFCSHSHRNRAASRSTPTTR